jgi:hypothetical protein
MIYEAHSIAAQVRIDCESPTQQYTIMVCERAVERTLSMLKSIDGHDFADVLAD